MSDVPTAPQTRVCSKCGNEYPLTAEYWHKRLGDFQYCCKACRRTYSREYYAANLEKEKQYREVNYEKRLAYSRVYHAEHREKRREYSRVYREENPEKVRLSRKTYREAHREQHRAYNRVYYVANREKLRVYARAYHAEHREKKRSYAREYNRLCPEMMKVRFQRRRARQRGLPAEYTAADWLRALDYFNGCCAVCGRQLSDLFGTHTAAQDHWIPLSAPDCPGTIPTNMVPLCHGIDGCNNSKHARRPDEWLIERYGKRKAAAILRRIAEFFEWVESNQVEDAA